MIGREMCASWKNAIERAVALGSGPLVHVADLPSNLQYPKTERLPEANELVPLEELERRAILRTLRETAGDKARGRAHSWHRQDHALPEAEAVPRGKAKPEVKSRRLRSKARGRRARAPVRLR